MNNLPVLLRLRWALLPLAWCLLWATNTHGALNLGEIIPVDQPVDVVVPLAEALDVVDNPFSWSVIGNGYLPWSGRLFVSHDGTDAAASGEVPPNGAATLQGKALGPGTLKWWWKVSSETNADYLKLFVDGVQQIRISGEVDWRQQSLHLGAGVHLLKWTYSKNGSGSVGSDKGWIDQPQLDPDTNCVFNLTPASRTHDFESVTGTVEVAASPDCSWPVVCADSWIVALSPLVNRGSGTVTYALARNSTTQPRTGFLTVAGRPFVITQSAAPANGLGTDSEDDTLRSNPPHIVKSLDVRINPFYIEAVYPVASQHSVAHDGVDAVQIGPVMDDRTASIHARVMGPGTISFWWKVSSETNVDLFKFFGPEGEVRISGEVDWQYRSYRFPPGSNEVFWVYAKDESVAVGNDRGWLDQLQFVPDTNCPVAISPNSRRHGFGAESGDIQVTVSSNCMWSVWATSDWINIPLIITNISDGVVNYTLAPNDSGQDRTGVIQIGNQIYTIFQTNGICTQQVSPASAAHSWHRETGVVTVATFTGCPLGLRFTNNWVSILSNTPLETGVEIVYTVAENVSFQPRSGALIFEHATYEILQMGKLNGPLFENNILGTNRVSTVGHRFVPPRPDAGPTPEGAPGLVMDYLIDQSQVSGGGGLLPNLSMSWDIDNQFTWKIFAPPGKKFVVQPPPGANAHFEGYLHWDSSGTGGYPPGSVAASFGGLEGTPPDIFGVAGLSETHGSFGLVSSSTRFTNSLSFTSLTLVGLVTPIYLGLGTFDFHPRLDSSVRVMYEIPQTNDPGRFVFLVPPDPPLNLRIVENNPTNGILLMLQGPRLRTNIVQISSDLVLWTPISTTVMPDTDCDTCPFDYILDRTSLNADRRFYRAVEK